MKLIQPSINYMTDASSFFFLNPCGLRLFIIDVQLYFKFLFIIYLNRKLMRSSDNVFNCQWSAYYLCIHSVWNSTTKTFFFARWVSHAMSCQVESSRFESSRSSLCCHSPVCNFVLFLLLTLSQHSASIVREKERYIMYGYEWMIFLVFFDRMCSDVLQRWLCIINIFWKGVGGAVWNPPVFSTKSTFLIPRGNNQNTKYTPKHAYFIFSRNTHFLTSHTLNNNSPLRTYLKVYTQWRADVFLN
jgi:hypothetical protein